MPGLRAFMEHLIDYAGLFPPAQLPLDQALANYTRYLHEPDRWMLSRFIVPAAQLEALRPLLRTQPDRLPLSALGRAVFNQAEFQDGVEEDVQAIVALRRSMGMQAIIDVFEVRLPPMDHYPAEVLTAVAHQLERAGKLTPFFEPPTGADRDAALRATVEAIVAYNSRASIASGLKLRCGGVEAAAFPSTAHVALAIEMCRDAGITLKATAGLHHPIRRFDASVQTKMHGFFNVFGAGILAHVHRLARAEIQTIVEEEKAAHFKFAGDAFAWQNLKATADEIAALRQNALIAFGSCSFDEPRDDLRKLGLLAA
jgi:hypothetical protein